MSLKGIIDRLRSRWYRIKYQYILKRAIFSRNVTVKGKLEIFGPGKVIFGAGVTIENDFWGESHVSITIHFPDVRMEIGDNVVLRGTKIGCCKSIKIGSGSVLEACYVMDSDFHNVDATKRNVSPHDHDRPILLGKDCYLGYMSQCSKGTTFENGVILLAGGTIANKRVPANIHLSGTPGRKIAPSL